MKNKLLIAVATGLLAAGLNTLPAQAGEVLVASDTPCGVDALSTDLLPYQAPGYRYQVIGSDVPPPAGWEQPAYDDSAWSVGAAGFGTGGGCPLDNTVQAVWPLSTDLLVRGVVSVPAGTVNLRVWISIDNDILEVFFNGTSLGNNIVHEGCAELDNFSFAVPQALVQAGPNVVAYHLRDRGVISFFDTRLSACVPLPPGCTLICLSHMVVPNDPGTCGAVVNYPDPTTAGSCSGLTVACTPPSGSSFPVGTNLVTCIATDPGGAVAASCSFNVIVKDTEPPKAGCVAVIPFKIFQNPLRKVGEFRLLATDNCDPDPKIYIGDSRSGFVAGPFHNLDLVEIGAGPSLTPSWHAPAQGPNVAVVFTKGDPLLWAVDSSGNASTPVKCK
jgi:hypothetical protein